MHGSFNVDLTLYCTGLVNRKTIKHSISLITCGEDLRNTEIENLVPILVDEAPG